MSLSDQLWLGYAFEIIPTIDGVATDICVRFGERIRERRKQLGWRQLDLAEHAGISENYVSELELGRKEACLRTMEALSLALKVELSELLKKDFLHKSDM